MTEQPKEPELVTGELLTLHAEGSAGARADAAKALAAIESDQPEPPCELPARGARSPNLVKIPSGTAREFCKDAKCGKAIWKVKHPKTGKPTPAACEPTVTLTDGTVVGTGAFPPYLDAAPGRDTLNIDGLGYSHFIDCPSSKAFRRS